MDLLDMFPKDFLACARFHGHICPGLALGYAAAKAGSGRLGVGASEDEEVVAIVENDSCAVDAIQYLLGCTFGKGNFIFRDWGKQVYTFIDRKTGRAVRVSFRGPMPGHEERRALKSKLDSGHGTDEDREAWHALRNETVRDLVCADPESLFDVTDVEMEMPPLARIVGTQACESCGEATVIERLVERQGRLICRGCSGESA